MIYDDDLNRIKKANNELKKLEKKLGNEIENLINESRNNNNNNNNNSNNNNNNNELKNNKKHNLSKCKKLYSEYLEWIISKSNTNKIWKNADMREEKEREQKKLDELLVFGPIDICKNKEAQRMRYELGNDYNHWPGQHIVVDKMGNLVKKLPHRPPLVDSGNVFRRLTHEYEIKRYRENMAYLYSGSKIAVAPFERIGDTFYQVKRITDFSTARRLGSGVYGYVHVLFVCLCLYLV